MVSDVRIKYTIEIPSCKPFKVRELARKFVERDYGKQYSLLWLYDVELRKVSPKNTLS